jgi:hypothetical protein
MSNGNDPIYVDAGQPATLDDGPRHIDCPTLQEAKIAWDRLPPVRQQSATISAGGQVYSAQQINRLHYGPKPIVSLSASDAAQSSAPPALDVLPQVLSSVDIAHNVFAAARRNMAVNTSGAVEPILTPENAGVSVSATPAAGTTPAEMTMEIPSIPPTNTAATLEVTTTGPLETSRGVPLVMQEGLAASSGGAASGRDELSASPLKVGAGADSVERTLSDRPGEIANAARALVQELAAQIEELKQSKPNDSGRLAQYNTLIPFLEKMAAGLGNLADALDRLAAPDGSPEPVLLGRAADAARWLQKAATEWLEANRTMVIDVPVRLGLFGLSVAFVQQLGIDSTAVTASLAYLAGLRSTQPRN